MPVRLAYWFGPLADLRRLPAIKTDGEVRDTLTRTTADQTSLSGIPRRDLLGVGKAWEFEWRTVTALAPANVAVDVVNFEWLATTIEAQRYPGAPDLYLRSPSWPNLLPASVRPFDSANWTVTLGRAQFIAPVGVTQISRGKVPCEVGEQLAASIEARSTSLSTATTLTYGFRWYNNLGNLVSDATVTSATLPNSASNPAVLSTTQTAPAGAVSCAMIATSSGANATLSRPRITRSGEPGSWFPPGGTARVIVDGDLEVTWVSATDANVRVRLLEAGAVVN